MRCKVKEKSLYNTYVETLFAERMVFYFDQCGSTNDEAQKIIAQGGTKDLSVVYSDVQNNGKGQRGSSWEASPSKNLTFSIILYPNDYSVCDQFYLSKITALALHDAFSEYLSSSLLRIKWPNDIYLSAKKIAGVLIENNLRGNKIQSSVVGIGVNVNQIVFENPNASSLSHALGYEINIEEILKSILQSFEFWYKILKLKDFNRITSSYENLLYLKEQWQDYTKENGVVFKGKILGVGEDGKLKVQTLEKIETFGIKEILYPKL